MERQTGVLQQRVQVLTVERGHLKTGERVRRQDDEQQKRHRDQGLHPQNARPQRRRQVSTKPCGHRPKLCKDKNPEQHRPLMVPPDARNLVDHRLVGVRVRHDKLQRKV